MYAITFMSCLKNEPGGNDWRMRGRQKSNSGHRPCHCIVFPSIKVVSVVWRSGSQQNNRGTRLSITPRVIRIPSAIYNRASTYDFSDALRWWISNPAQCNNIFLHVGLSRFLNGVVMWPLRLIDVASCNHNSVVPVGSPANLESK